MKRNKVVIVGIGPGSPQYITEQASSAIKAADSLVGSRRALAAARDLKLTKEGASFVELPPSGMVEAVTTELERELAKGGSVALVVSGDPGFYSLAYRVRNAFGRERVESVVGISSLQLLASRLCRSWVGVPTISLHTAGRVSAEKLRAIASLLSGAAAAVVLLGADPVSQIRQLAEEEELAGAWAAVGWNLGLADELVVEAENLQELAAAPGRGELALLWLAERDRA